MLIHKINRNGIREIQSSQSLKSKLTSPKNILRFTAITETNQNRQLSGLKLAPQVVRGFKCYNNKMAVMLNGFSTTLQERNFPSRAIHFFSQH